MSVKFKKLLIYLLFKQHQSWAASLSSRQLLTFFCLYRVNMVYKLKLSLRLTRLYLGNQIEIVLLKTVAFIAGKSENPAAQNFFICFSIDNLIANISLYALSWPKLNFGCYLTFEIIF